MKSSKPKSKPNPYPYEFATRPEEAREKGLVFHAPYQQRQPAISMRWQTYELWARNEEEWRELLRRWSESGHFEYRPHAPTHQQRESRVAPPQPRLVWEEHRDEYYISTFWVPVVDGHKRADIDIRTTDGSRYFYVGAMNKCFETLFLAKQAVASALNL